MKYEKLEIGQEVIIGGLEYQVKLGIEGSFCGESNLHKGVFNLYNLNKSKLQKEILNYTRIGKFPYCKSLEDLTKFVNYINSKIVKLDPSVLIPGEYYELKEANGFCISKFTRIINDTYVDSSYILPLQDYFTSKESTIGLLALISIKPASPAQVKHLKDCEAAGKYVEPQEGSTSDFKHGELLAGDYNGNLWWWLHDLYRDEDTAYLAAFGGIHHHPINNSSYFAFTKFNNKRKATEEDIQKLAKLGYEVKANQFVKIEKIEKKDEWWKDLKKGDYVVSLKSRDNCHTKNHVYEVEKPYTYGVAYIKSNRFQGKSEPEWFRLATKKEGELFKHAGKPVDVTTYIISKTVKKWDVDTYVVFLEDNIQSNSYKKGEIGKIINVDSKRIHYYSGCVNDISGPHDASNKLQWFATKKEAEEFSEDLLKESNSTFSLDDLAKEICSFPLEASAYLTSQAELAESVEFITKPKPWIKCATQEEWDFVAKKLGRTSTIPFKEIGDSILITIPNSSAFTHSNFYTFTEWCEENNYLQTTEDEHSNIPKAKWDIIPKEKEYQPKLVEVKKSKF
ncbi:MAG: hypothetical protein GY775_16875 [Candidatus Scalindua sp.]|nr:hypothetical protein [Candidatus Scalindua sp.]